MGWLDSIFGGYGNKDVGNQVLESYFDEAIKYPEFAFSSYESWVAFLESRVPEFVALIGELVNSNSAATTANESAGRLYALANDSAGQASISQITATAGGGGNTVNWMAAIPEIAMETGSTILSTVQNVGTGALATVNLTRYLPWILGGAAVLYIGVVANKTSGHVGRLIDAGASRIRKNPRSRSPKTQAGFRHLSEKQLWRLYDMGNPNTDEIQWEDAAQEKKALSDYKFAKRELKRRGLIE